MTSNPAAPASSRELEAIGDYLGEFGERTPPALVAEQRRVAAELAEAAAVA